MSRDLLHASGFLSDQPFTYLEAGEHRVLLTGPMEAARARRESRATVVHDREEFGIRDLLGEARSPDAAVADTIVRLLDCYGVRSVLVPPAFPTFLADYLRAAGQEVHPTLDVCERRRRKREYELACIEEAECAAESALAVAVSMIAAADIGRDGVLLSNGGALTAERIRAAIDIRLLELGYSTEDSIVAPGPQSSDPHCAGAGPCRANEPIVIDICPRSKRTRYCADLARTVCRGEPPNVVAWMHARVLEALGAAIATLDAGVFARAIDQKVETLFGQHGLGTPRQPRPGAPNLVHDVGHGVGLDVHEAPFIGSGSIDEIQQFDVVALEPGLYLSGIGGVRVEDLLVVLPGAKRNLARSPRDLVLPA